MTHGVVEQAGLAHLSVHLESTVLRRLIAFALLQVAVAGTANSSRTQYFEAPVVQHCTC